MELLYNCSRLWLFAVNDFEKYKFANWSVGTRVWLF